MAAKKPRHSRKKLLLIPILVIGVAAVYVPVMKSTFFKPEKIVLDEMDLPGEADDVDEADDASTSARRSLLPPLQAAVETSPLATPTRNDVPLAFGDLSIEETAAPEPRTRVLNGFLDFGGTLLAIVDGRVVADGDRIGDAVVERVLPGQVLLRTDGESTVLQLASNRGAEVDSPDDGGDEER